MHTIVYQGGLLSLIELVIIFSPNGNCWNLIKSLQMTNFLLFSFLSILGIQISRTSLPAIVTVSQINKSICCRVSHFPHLCFLTCCTVCVLYVCFMLVQHCCDSEGNIMGLKRLQATAYNCLSVPYGNPASGPDTQSFSASNRANLINEFPF